jgi:hypothetical protein
MPGDRTTFAVHRSDRRVLTTDDGGGGGDQGISSTPRPV